MKNFDSYYDPPEDPRDQIFEWLDGEFRKEVDRISGSVYDLEMKAIKDIKIEFSIDEEEAEEIVVEWLRYYSL